MNSYTVLRLARKGTYLLLLAMLALGLALGTGFLSRASADTTVAVKPSAMSGWGFLQEVATGTGSFVTGPATAPSGSGSARMTVDATGRMLLGTLAHAGTRLDQITNLQYSTYRSSADAGNLLAITLQFDMDYDLTDATTAWQGRLVFEPYFTAGSGNIPQNTWQTWTPLSGLWWASGAPGNTVCPQASPCTWSAVLTTFPNAGLRVGTGVAQFKAGGPWPGFDGNVDAFTIGISGVNTTYDFEPETPCTTVCYVDAVNGNDSFGGDTPASAKKTIQAAVNQVDVGGMVIVAPGTYNESPNINKSLTLQSSGGRDVTTIMLQTGPTYLGGLTINGAEVTVDGFTITGFDAVGSGLASSNIVVTTAPDNVVITNNRIRVGAIGAGSNGDDGMGLITYYNTSSDVDTLTVTDNIFEPLNASGTRAFFINPGVNHFVFRQNQINGNFTRNAITQAKDGLVEENTVTGVGAAGSRSRGLGTWGYPDPTVYGHTTFRKNTISNTSAGITVFETESVVIENNFFSDNDNGVRVMTSVPLAFDVSTIHVNGNSLLNNYNDGVNKDPSVTGVLDASANWWGGNTPSGVATEVNADVDYTPWLDVGTDTSGDSGFQGDFSVLNVDDDSPQSGSVGRVQEGVNLVTASTVHVVAGTYVEQVVIADSLTIFGDGAASTFIVAPSTIPIASNPDSAIVKITGAGVDVEMYGFTVTGPGPSGCGSLGVGIFVRDDAHANIHDNHILDIRDNPISGCQNGIGILVGRVAFGTNGTAEITDNLIQGYQKGGIVVSNAGSSATISGNTVTGAGAVSFIAQNGIQVSGGATADIVGNTVSGHSYTPFTWVSTGVLLYYADVDTNGNMVTENQVGIYHIGGSGTHDGNTVTASASGTGSPGGFWGIVVDDPPPTRQPSPFAEEGDGSSAPTTAFSAMSVSSSSSSAHIVSVTNNVLTGDGTSTSIGLEADAGGYGGTLDIDLTATNNYIQNWGYGVVLAEYSKTFVNADINFNSITSNDVGFDNYSIFLADGEKNWWGDAFGPSGVGPGTGDSVSANVDYDPWLCDDTDTDLVAIGFQPDPDNIDCAGPITSNVVATPNPAPVNGSVMLTANVDDTIKGGSTIASAEYSLDGGPWTMMLSSDNAFDEVNEEVTVTFAAPSTPGVYDLCVRGTDAGGATGAAECIMFVVYDPTGGFVTGGGWIDSPAGACLDTSICIDATGKATFGFVSKYKKGMSVPSGNTEFQFKAGNLHFQSTAYDWLVVAGTKAQYKGSGAINGALATNGTYYRFILTAIDNSPDKFRIRIWSEDNAGVEYAVYDNGFDGSGYENGQPIGGGSIVIHK